MSSSLPPPLAAYIAASNRSNAPAFAACFAPDAVVHDEGRVHQGRPAITAWFNEVSEKYRATMSVQGCDTMGDETVLRCEVAGNFEGSPIELSYRLILRDDLIASLRITAD